MIGLAGIGGIIIVPFLIYVLEIPASQAIATTMFAYIPSGLIGMTVVLRDGKADWKLAGRLWLCALPGALIAALLVSHIAARWLEVAIAGLMLASGIHTLRTDQRLIASRRTALTPARQSSVGAITGFASALTGTSGPMILIPVLLWFDTSALSAVSLAQGIQLPISVAATSATALSGQLDLVTGLMIGTGIAIGTLCGIRLARRLSSIAIRKVVSLLLLTVGAAILVRVVVTF